MSRTESLTIPLERLYLGFIRNGQLLHEGNQDDYFNLRNTQVKFSTPGDRLVFSRQKKKEEESFCRENIGHITEKVNYSKRKIVRLSEDKYLKDKSLAFGTRETLTHSN